MGEARLSLGIREVSDPALELSSVAPAELYIGPDGYLKRKLSDGSASFIKVKPPETVQKEPIVFDSSEVGAVAVISSKTEAGEVTVSTRDLAYATPATDRIQMTPGGKPMVMVVEAVSVEGNVLYMVRLRSIEELLGLTPVDKAGDAMTGELTVPAIDVGS